MERCSKCGSEMIEIDEDGSVLSACPSCDKHTIEAIEAVDTQQAPDRRSNSDAASHITRVTRTFWINE